MATKEAIRQRVGEDLGRVPIGQDLEYQDQVRIDTTFDEVYARLEEKGLATWAQTAEVPDKLVPYYVLMMEVSLLTSFSVPETRSMRIKLDAGQDGDLAEKKLAKLAISSYESVESEAGF